jgi:hypothetical protein
MGIKIGSQCYFRDSNSFKNFVYRYYSNIKLLFKRVVVLNVNLTRIRYYSKSYNLNLHNIYKFIPFLQSFFKVTSFTYYVL